MSWDPRQYHRFQDERSRPFHDLAALVEPRPSMRVVDLGCGTGELTALLHQKLAAAETVGVDNSDSMLARAAEHAGPGLRFVKGDLAQLEGEHDLIFSNAALHWAPDHQALLEKLCSRLAPGGQLAVQVPANHDHPSHTVAAEVAREAPFPEALHGYVRASPVLAPEAYAALLDALGFREQRARLEVYVHHLASRDEVVEWVKGTLLTDYQSRLSPALYEKFLARYRERLLPALSPARPYFYPFKRILFWGTR